MRNITAPVGRDSANRDADVILIQQLLNLKAWELSMQPMRIDGQPTEDLYLAIEHFQDQVCRMRKPDGVIDPGRRTFKKLSRLTVGQRAAMDEDWIVPWAPKWIQVAGTQLGTHEFRTYGKNNPEVMKYIDTVPALMTADFKDKNGKTRICGEYDESAWCGCFVNWCLIQAGFPGHTGIDAARAADWVTYGKDLKGKPEYGAIVSMYKRIDGKGTNHVGFYMGERNGGIVVLGGNQENYRKPGGRVCVTEYHGYRVNGYMWPLRTNDDE